MEAMQEVLADRYDEDTQNWKETKSMIPCKISIDAAQHNLLIQDAGKSSTEVIEFVQMANVRSEPYLDETKLGCLDEDKANQFVTPLQKKRFFSISYYKGHVDFVHVHIVSFVVADEATAETWRAGLAGLIKSHYQHSSRYVTMDERMERIHSSLVARKDKHGNVTSKALNMYFKDVQYASLKTALGFEGKGIPVASLALDKFKQCVTDTLLLPPMKTVVATIMGDKGNAEPSLTVAQMVTLINKDHRDPRWNEIHQPESTAAEMAKRFLEYTDGKSDAKLGVADFYRFLSSPANDVLGPAPMMPSSRTVSQEMTLPLAHYYCDSSHNSYLTGKQVLDRSSVEIYRQILLCGCRCLEIDIWNGQTYDGTVTAIVTHGKASCTNVLFTDVLKAIKETAFTNSDYPVVLSFENHCDAANQTYVAKQCKAIFGDLLQSAYMDGDGKVGMTSPPLEKLKRKIIIKNKRTKALVILAKLGHGSPGKGGESATAAIKVDGEEIVETEQERLDREARSKDIVKELSDIINYVWPIHFPGFDVARATNNRYHMSSFNEHKGKKLLSGDPEGFVEYTSRQVARIYPMGTRIQSSNYNPIVYWNVGAQMVALNYQTLGTGPMRNNLGKFFHNGGCGYIKKPLCMIDPSHKFDPFRRTTIDMVPALAVKVQVLAAPCVGGGQPEVEVKIQGLPVDTTVTPMKTRPFKRRTNPVPFWQADNTADFPKVILPEAAQLAITVYDHSSGGIIGWSVLTLDEIRPGYRIIPLRFSDSPMAHVVVKISTEIYSGAHGDFADRLADPTRFSRKTDKNLALMAALDEGEEEGGAEAEAEAKGFALPANSSGAAGKGSVARQASLKGKAGGPGSNAAGREDNYALYDSVEQIQEVRDFKKVCDGILAGLADSKTVQQQDETKALVSARESHIKKRNKCMAGHNKEVKGLRAGFGKAIKGVFKDKIGEVKKALKKKGSMAVANATTTAAIAVANTELIALEEKLKSDLRTSFEKFTGEIHPLMKAQEEDIGKIKLAEVERRHEAQIRAQDKKFDPAFTIAVKGAKKKFDAAAVARESKAAKQEWREFEEGLQADLITEMKNSKTQVHRVHMREKAFVQSEVEASAAELGSVQALDLTTLAKQHADEREMLEKLKAMKPEDPNRIGWENMNAEQYIATLVDMGRLPRI